jgi:hypothetical protein
VQRLVTTVKLAGRAGFFLGATNVVQIIATVKTTITMLVVSAIALASFELVYCPIKSDLLTRFSMKKHERKQDSVRYL